MELIEQCVQYLEAKFKSHVKNFFQFAEGKCKLNYK